MRVEDFGNSKSQMGRIFGLCGTIMGLKLVKAALALPMDDPSAKLLLVAMAYVSEKGEVWANKETLMALTSLKTTTYYRKLNQLIKSNILEKSGHRYEQKFTICLNVDIPNSTNRDVNLKKQNANLEKRDVNLENPYIGTETNGIITELNGVVSKKRFIEGADIGGVPREWASDWYDQCVEEGWFYNPRTNEPKPYAKNHGLMVRKCVRYFNEHGRNLKKKSEKKALVNQPEHIRTMTANTRLKEILSQKENHPGDPGAYQPVESDHPERERWWQLCEEEKQIKNQLINA